MAQPSPNFTYLQLDFASHKAALIQRIQNRYPGVFNDFFAGSFGILLINIVAWSTATLAYAINRVAGENFVGTMTLRESAVRLGNLTGYSLANPFPATVYCQAKLSTPAPAEVTLTAGITVRTGDSSAIVFQLAQNYTIPAGAYYPQSLAASFNPNTSGSQVVQSLVQVTAGGFNVDCLDDTVDLRQYVLAGQVFSIDDLTFYTITNVTQAPGATSYNRLVLSTAWAGVTTATAGSVYEQRVAFIQAQTQQDQFNPASGAGFSAILSGSPVIDGSVTVTVNGQTWTAANLATADSDAQVFQTKTLPVNFQTAVLFGNGSLGAAPPNNSSIIVSYKVGGGVAGNISSSAINTTITGIITSLSSPVIVNVTNLQGGSGGVDAESVNQARLDIPAYTSTGQRAVTFSDYSALAIAYRSTAGQVKFASASTNTQNALLEGNIVNVYAWTTAPDGSLTPVAGLLKSNLQAYLQSCAVGTDYVLMADGVTQSLPLAVKVRVAQGYTPATVAGDVSAAVAAYVDGLTPGQSAIYSDLLNTVSNVAGVQQANLAAPSTDVTVPNIDTAIIPPSDTETYQVSLLSVAQGQFNGQLQYVPRYAWALSATFNGQPVTVSPDVNAGFARLTGQGIDPAKDSSVNLTTGLVNLYVTGPIGDLEFQYTQVQAYDTVRTANVYVGYTGDQTQATRRAVRAAIRTWADGLAVGAAMYAYPPAVANPATSIYDVVNNFNNIGMVTKVALDMPTNTNPQVNVGSTTLAVLGNVYVNNYAD